MTSIHQNLDYSRNVLAQYLGKKVGTKCGILYLEILHADGYVTCRSRNQEAKLEAISVTPCTIEEAKDIELKIDLTIDWTIPQERLAHKLEQIKHSILSVENEKLWTAFLEELANCPKDLELIVFPIVLETIKERSTSAWKIPTKTAQRFYQNIYQSYLNKTSKNG